jgi:hypothetical protein
MLIPTEMRATVCGKRVERRLEAVLAADVAGYSRLMGTDEEGTLERLKACRQALIDPIGQRSPVPQRGGRRGSSDDQDSHQVENRLPKGEPQYCRRSRV